MPDAAVPVPSPRRPVVAVVGDGDGADPHAVAAARAVGRLLVEGGCRVLTGGRGGVTESACAGARAAAAYREGDTIGVLPGDDARAANPFVDIALPTGLGHGRNALVARADAVVAIGGGAGTLSEICFAWLHDRLVVALVLPGGRGWSSRLAGTRLDERARFAAEDGIDDDRIHAAATPEEAVAEIARRLPAYRAARPDPAPS